MVDLRHTASIEVFNNPSIPIPTGAIHTSKYVEREGFNIKDVKNSIGGDFSALKGWEESLSLMDNFSTVNEVVGTLVNVRDSGLIIGWELLPDMSNVGVYTLKHSNNFDYRVGRLRYKNLLGAQTYQDFVANESCLSRLTVEVRLWDLIMTLFPILKNVELFSSCSESQLSVATSVIHKAEYSVEKHIANMVKKTIRAMESDNDDN